MSMGSVQRLPNNNTLINWGFFLETNILDAGTYISEVDYDKNPVLTLYLSYWILCLLWQERQIGNLI